MRANLPAWHGDCSFTRDGQPALKLTSPFPTDQATQRDKTKSELSRIQELLCRSLSGLQEPRDLCPYTRRTCLSEFPV